MSNITRLRPRLTSIRTDLIAKGSLRKAIEDLHYHYKEGNLMMRDGRQRIAVDILLTPQRGNASVGFRRAGETYEIYTSRNTARKLDRQKFIERLTQRYAYHVTMDKLTQQGFALAEEEVQADGQIRLVLRRMT